LTIYRYQKWYKNLLDGNLCQLIHLLERACIIGMVSNPPDLWLQIHVPERRCTIDTIFNQRALLSQRIHAPEPFRIGMICSPHLQFQINDVLERPLIIETTYFIQGLLNQWYGAIALRYPLDILNNHIR
jgi:hypothetical protein